MEYGRAMDQKIQWTPEEMEILKECNNEASQRGVAISVVSSGLSYVAFQRAMENKKYVIPATIFCGTMGYIFGKLSYLPNCMQRITQMPNNTLSKVINERMHQPDATAVTRPRQLPRQQQQFFGDNATDFGTVDSNTFNEISSRDGFSSAEDTSFNDDQNEGEPEIDPVKPGTSYGELRQKNREEYLRARAQRFAQIPASQSTRRVVTTVKPESSDGSSTGSTKYGDVWDE